MHLLAWYGASPGVLAGSLENITAKTSVTIASRIAGTKGHSHNDCSQAKSTPVFEKTGWYRRMSAVAAPIQIANGRHTVKLMCYIHMLRSVVCNESTS
jgi:hypothetical protein